jgi:hypothetical protein
MGRWTTTGTGKSTLGDVLGVVLGGQTYRNLLYLFLAFPLGLLYYIALSLGFTLGLGLSVLVVGIGILLGTVIGLRYIAAFERRLANTLLRTAIPDPNDVENSDGLVETLKSYLQAPSTWRGLAFIMLKFPLGILAFILLVSFLGTGLELLLIPLFPEGAFNVEVFGWEVARSIQTSTQQAVAVPVGVLLALVALYIVNAVAKANGLIASALLGPGSDERSQGQTESTPGD